MFVNGKEIHVGSNTSVFELLKELKLGHEKVVVELNYEILQKEYYSETILNEGDRVEIVRFVGGG